MNEPGPDPIPESRRNPFRCFDRAFLLESLLVALLVVGIALASRTQPRGSALRIAAAALESLAFGWIAARSVLRVRRLDELQQRIHLTAIAISFTLTGVVLVAAGFFDRAGLGWRPWGAELWVGMVLVWWLAVVVLNRRYR
jgi:hypothetical protein